MKEIKTFSTIPKVSEKKEEIPCPICGASLDKARNHWICDGFSFKRCLDCGHLYQNPQPRPDDLLNRYDEDYKDYEIENAQNFFDLMERGLEDLGFFEIEAGLSGEKSFLDVGCATGVLVKFAQDRNWDSFGLEVCEPAAIYARNERGVRVISGTLDQSNFPPESFDIIHSSHVIEHVPEPNVFLRQIYDLLKPGGRLLLVTPNRSSLQAFLLGKKWRSAIADHTHIFSKKHLEYLLVRAGFSLESFKTWGGWPLGLRPKLLKPLIDQWAKQYNFGDVIAVRAIKQP